MFFVTNKTTPKIPFLKKILPFCLEYKNADGKEITKTFKEIQKSCKKKFHKTE